MLKTGPRAGFTLIELMAVMIVIGIVLAVVFPRFTSMGHTYLKTDASKLQTLITYIYEASETKHLYYRINFDLEDESVKIESSKDGVEFSPEADRTLKALNFSPGVDLAEVEIAGLGTASTGELRVLFSPTGTAKSFKVSLKAGDGGPIDIIFNPYSGRVKIEDAL